MGNRDGNKWFEWENGLEDSVGNRQLRKKALGNEITLWLCNAFLGEKDQKESEDQIQF